MSAIDSTIDLGRLEADSKPDGLVGGNIIKISAIAGFGLIALSFFLSLFSGDLSRFLQSYLVSYLFFMAITLGSLLFIVLQHIVRAGWSVPIRRITEIYASNVYLMAILFIPILLGVGSLYEWTDPEVVATDALIAHKTPFLNIYFFVFRCALYFTVWILATRFFVRRSIAQDQSGDPELTLQMQGKSAPFMIGLFLTITFFAFDIIMSLDAHWFSTIFGVYYIANCAICVFASIALTATTLQSMGKLKESVNTEHFHDTGKLLFGFIVFWAYIAYSQYMLYWYANMPETTTYYYYRQDGQWLYVSLLLIFGKFIFPFFGLISREIKRRKFLLCFWAAWMLIMVWIDMYWLVMPTFSKQVIPFSIFDITCLIGIGALYVAMAAFTASKQSLLAYNDPRLKESLSYENF